MFNLGPFELVAIFVVALLVFGPEKLPEMGRQVGKAFREFKKFQASMESNVRDVLDPITGPIVNNGPVGPPPTNVRDGGTVAAEAQAQANVPRSATIQDPEQSEGEEASAPGKYGYYAPTEPAAAPNDDSRPSSEATAPTPPEHSTDPGPDPR